ncbi:DUF3631 domain-containing protein [Mycolicibacterium sp. 141076]|uniref:DUF3631 domain-containing protein n=1 Tax=Mycolicibacterium sp. 141076 TaxID=3090599 RepID=UPI00299CE0AA|nr:DUF3631 domain-containing protein [Mycolicibacterium sp. 141076]MDX1878216.1 DUF3631 domain-containing protein [Mycolicibacterium sp. 141076]
MNNENADDSPKANLAELLNQVHTTITKYVAFPSEHHSVVVALWVLHTWVVNAFYVTPRLIWDSAEPGSGKTRGLELLALLCRAAKLTLSTTTAALYRRIAAAEDEGLQPPTVLQDEADAIFGKTSTPQSEDLRALFNAGYRKGATVDRCEGDAKNMKVREFPVHAPVSLAGLAGRMPDTIRTRGITLHMRRRRPDQKVADFRERDALVEVAPIREQLAAWSRAAFDDLAAARPAMPNGVTDRSAEIWEPLLAIADMAESTWPSKARAACTFFVVDSAADDEKLSLGQRLLRDIKTVFDAHNTDTMWTTDLIAALKKDDESEWRDLWGKPLDARRLANELKKYGVRSKDVRQGIVVAKGYSIGGATGLGQAWGTWLPTEISATSATSATDGPELGKGRSGCVADESGSATIRNAVTSDVTAVALVADKPELVPATASQSASAEPRCQQCKAPLWAPQSVRRGYCEQCQQTRRSANLTVINGKQPSAAKWLDNEIKAIRATGRPQVDSSDVLDRAEASGHKRQTIVAEASKHPDIKVVGRGSFSTLWWIDPTQQPPTEYRSAPEFINEYVSAVPNGAEIDKTDLKAKGTPRYSWENLRKAIKEHPDIQVDSHGPRSTWTVQRDAEESA